MDATGHRGGSNDVNWAPMPQIVRIVLTPALWLLGATDEPTWMERAGRISMEVAKNLIADAARLYRISVDALTSVPLRPAPGRYRIGRAMRTSIQLKEECCQFRDCVAKATTSPISHIGGHRRCGSTTSGNLEALSPFLTIRGKASRTIGHEVASYAAFNRVSVRE